MLGNREQLPGALRSGHSSVGLLTLGRSAKKMNKIGIITCLTFLICLPLHGGVEEPIFGDGEDVVYSDYAIPINKEANEAITLTLKRLNCSLAEFLKMNGVPFTKESSCSLDPKAEVVRLNTNHKSATMAVMILGHIMVELRQGRLTPQQYAEQYDNPFSKAQPVQDSNKESEMATPKKPSD